MKEKIRSSLMKSGAVAVGFAKAGPVDAEVTSSFEKWIEEGCNGEMEYLRRHIPLRKTSESVLPGAKTVVCMAFDYTPKEWIIGISAYAYGEDYHNQIRERLKGTLSDFKAEFGGKWRLCIDSAPISERYWAMRSGIGRRGLNGALILEGCGPFCFLAELLTTIEITPDSPSIQWCEKCGNCIRSCPGGALKGDGTMDARKCINYLTIEKKEEFTPEEKELLRKGGGSFFGCDRCFTVCPHRTLEGKEEILPEIKNLTPDVIPEMDETTFIKEFKRTPLHYAGYNRLLRNALALQKEK